MANKDTLKDIRNKIDQLDLSILKFLSQRVELVIKAGKIKKFFRKIRPFINLKGKLKLLEQLFRIIKVLSVRRA
jgi:chorismate mutase